MSEKQHDLKGRNNSSTAGQWRDLTGQIGFVLDLSRLSPPECVNSSRHSP